MSGRAYSNRELPLEGEAALHVFPTPGKKLPDIPKIPGRRIFGEELARVQREMNYIGIDTLSFPGRHWDCIYGPKFTKAFGKMGPQELYMDWMVIGPKPDDEVPPLLPTKDSIASEIFSHIPVHNKITAIATPIIVRVFDITEYVYVIGAQPVSFNERHIDSLMTQDYFVCEKTDGVRVLLYMTRSALSRPSGIFIDRKNEYYTDRVLDLFVIPISNNIVQDKTLIDGELVFTDNPDGSRTVKFLVFDALYVNGVNIQSKPLNKRLGYLDQQVIRPYLKAYASVRDDLKRGLLIAQMKRMELPYAIPQILSQAKERSHKSDGLIFTGINDPYMKGTCESMLKWKPAEENSIDFKVHVTGETNMVTGLPRLDLYAYHGREGYKYYAPMALSQEEWENNLKHVQLEGKVVEVCYDPTHSPPEVWRFMRFRDDKEHGNYITIINKILTSISENITSQRVSSLYRYCTDFRLRLDCKYVKQFFFYLDVWRRTLVAY
ncbi:Dcp1p-Dcp2p decapping enzyme complex alpha subunit [Mycoemilia scoparia]|uniref:mRNA guanylyltransferase n=1 Tax=Mycoemilia scoparia TaxID=417184 RepID=A0A9W8A4E1_9FUNG|nr:Dcp1p-Dcp2p decapping enzyme complex alpha subunit [Mycoemilia scoparia]